MFSNELTRMLVAAANARGIEPAAFLALVEVETGGKAFEEDGSTPRLLYERHVAWREAAKRAKGLLARFASAGLAIQKWSKATQYQDQRSSAQRLDLIKRACAIDPAVAQRSASWGLFQIMGFLAEELRYADVEEMVASLRGSIAGQIEAGVRELEHKNLLAPLNAHDWPHVARVYNGPRYAENHYDIRLADAHKRWTRRLATAAAAPPAPEDALSRDAIRAIQSRLRDRGYTELGQPDGLWGTKTTGAIAAFQAHEGLPVTGHYDTATAAALEEAISRPAAEERAQATVEDLRAGGSRTVAVADRQSWVGKLMGWLGLGGLAGGGAEQGGLLDRAQSGVEAASRARGILDAAHDLVQPVLSHPGILVFAVALLGLGVAVWWLAERIKAYRLEDHRTGAHAGPAAA